MKKIISMAAVGVLVLAACGDDDDGGGSGSGSVDDVVDALVTSFESDPDLEGVELDESCLRGIAEGLSESDRAAIAEAFRSDDPNAEPEGLSPEGEAAGLQILDCIDFNFGELLDDERSDRRRPVRPGAGDRNLGSARWPPATSTNTIAVCSMNAPVYSSAPPRTSSGGS